MNEEPRVFKFHHASPIFGDYKLTFTIIRELDYQYDIKITNDLNDAERSLIKSYVSNIDEYIEELNGSIYSLDLTMEDTIFG